MIPDSVEFTVTGTPVPQGSMRAFVRGGRAVVTSDNERLHEWRARVAAEGDRAMGVFDAFDCPVRVAAVFTMPRPKKPRFRWPAVRPDGDKLARALLDGLTGPVLVDDSRVVDLHVVKVYGDTPGVRVRVEAW